MGRGWITTRQADARKAYRLTQRLCVAYQRQQRFSRGLVTGAKRTGRLEIATDPFAQTGAPAAAVQPRRLEQHLLAAPVESAVAEAFCFYGGFLNQFASRGLVTEAAVSRPI